jgi:hypothetical protein
MKYIQITVLVAFFACALVLTGCIKGEVKNSNESISEGQISIGPYTIDSDNRVDWITSTNRPIAAGIYQIALVSKDGKYHVRGISTIPLPVGINVKLTGVSYLATPSAGMSEFLVVEPLRPR